MCYLKHLKWWSYTTGVIFLTMHDTNQWESFIYCTHLEIEDMESASRHILIHAEHQGTEVVF